MASKAQLLSGAQKRYLRALAHSLSPVVQVGKSGLGKGVLSEIGDALHVHELIKVKLAKEATIELGEAARCVEVELGATIAQTIGRTLVLYRRHPDKPKIALPKKGAKTKPEQKGSATKAGRPGATAATSAASSWLSETANDDDDDDGDVGDDE